MPNTGAGDGRIFIPRPPADARKADDGISIYEQLDRAFEIQMEANRRLRANPLYRALFVVAAFAALPLFDLWLAWIGLLGPDSDAFTLLCIAGPWLGLAVSAAVWLRRRRA